MTPAPEMSDRFEKLALLLALFEKHGVDYVLVGESPTKLRTSIDGDVDIVVSWAGNRKLPSVFRDLRDSHGIKLVHVYRHEIGVFGALLVWRLGDTWNRLGPDICSDYYRNGHRLFHCEEILSGRSRDIRTGFWFPRPEMDFCYYVTKKIEKGSVSDSQMTFLRAKLESSDEMAIKGKLIHLLRQEQIDEMLRWVREGDRASLSSALAEFHRTIRRRTRPSIVTKMQRLVHFCRRIPEPNGIVVFCENHSMEIESGWKELVAPLFRLWDVVQVNGSSLPFTQQMCILFRKWHSSAVLVVERPHPTRIVRHQLKYDLDISRATTPDAVLELVVHFLSDRTARRCHWRSNNDLNIVCHG